MLDEGVILIIGNHTRHLFLAEEISKRFRRTYILAMRREPEQVDSNSFKGSAPTALLKKHFDLRTTIEHRVLGNSKSLDVISNEVEVVDSQSLNSNSVVAKLEAWSAHAEKCFVFGVDLLKEQVMRVLPYDTFNIHLGLSPWYRGSATLFWPFVMLQPNWAGVTIHRLKSSADSGNIIHQFVPSLDESDRLHDVGVRCVSMLPDELDKVLYHFRVTKMLEGIPQPSIGKLWLMRDFNVGHLQFIYDLYDDKIVEKYLNGEFGFVQAPVLRSIIGAN